MDTMNFIDLVSLISISRQYSITGVIIGLHFCMIRTTEVAGLIRTPVQLQATLSKLLIFCVLRQTQPPILSGTGNEQ